MHEIGTCCNRRVAPRFRVRSTPSPCIAPRPQRRVRERSSKTRFDSQGYFEGVLKQEQLGPGMNHRLGVFRNPIQSICMVPYQGRRVPPEALRLCVKSRRSASAFESPGASPSPTHRPRPAAAAQHPVACSRDAQTRQHGCSSSKNTTPAARQRSPARPRAAAAPPHRCGATRDTRKQAHKKQRGPPSPRRATKTAPAHSKFAARRST